MNADRIRAAMDRLLFGQPIHTDGRLTIANLAKEARVPRTTMNRNHSDLVVLFQERCAALQSGAESPPQAALDKARLDRDQWRRKAREWHAKVTERDERIRALENQVYFLDQHAQRLEARLAESSKVLGLRAAPALASEVSPPAPSCAAAGRGSGLTSRPRRDRREGGCDR
jgi:hypothetical protein